MNIKKMYYQLQLVDQNLYTAALEYTFMDTTEIYKSDFPHDRLSV